MSWRQGPQDFSRLNQLGNITARLIRLAALGKIKRGEAQLMFYGIEPGLVDYYKEHALTERYVLIPKKRKVLENRIQITEPDTNTF